MKARILAIGALLVAGGLSAQAEDAYLASVEERLANLERELNIMRGDAKGKDILSEDIPVYVKPKSKYIEEMKLRGRIQWQFGLAEPTGSSTAVALPPGTAVPAGVPAVIGRTNNGSYSTFEIRRLYIGIEATLLGDFFAMADLSANLGSGTNGGGGLGVNLNETYIQYRGMDAFQPIVGHFKPTFLVEENISDTVTLTVERSRLTNILIGESGFYRTGLAIGGKYNMFSYSAGVFNKNVTFQPVSGNGTLPAPVIAPIPGVINPANSFVQNSQDYIYNVSAGLDPTELTGARLKVRTDYMHYKGATALGGNTFVGAGGTNWAHNVAAGVEFGIGGFDFLGQFGTGFDHNALQGNQGILYGFTAMPSYYIIPKKLQIVGRYEWIQTDGIPAGTSAVDGNTQVLFTGTTLPGRYGTRTGSGSFGTGYTTPGDQYQAVYGGMNYYINGNDLKLMLGVEWAQNKVPQLLGPRRNDETFTLYTAVRMQF